MVRPPSACSRCRFFTSPSSERKPRTFGALVILRVRTPGLAASRPSSTAPTAGACGVGIYLMLESVPRTPVLRACAAYLFRVCWWSRRSTSTVICPGGITPTAGCRTSPSTYAATENRI
jgi:hypothetical protein